MNFLRWFCFVPLIVLGTAMADTRYVWSNSPSPGAPFTSWATAAHAIQDAVDVSIDGDIVWVTNGVYALETQITITNGIAIRSVNGPTETVIDGGNTVRCVFIACETALVTGFTVRNGTVDEYSAGGGGVLIDGGGTVSDCIIVSNTATGSFDAGGGVKLRSGGLLANSFIAYNSGVFAISVHLAGIVSNCVIRDNYSAGIRLSEGGEVLESIVLHNEGIGISIGDAGWARRCQSRHNAGYGARLIDGGVIENCVMADNGASGLIIGEDATAINCTVVRNGISGLDHGVRLLDDSSSVYNTISWFHGEDMDISVAQDEHPTIVNCWKEGEYGPPAGFVSSNDFRLTLGSLGIDAGADLPEVTTDLDGNPRPLDGNNDGTSRWDIGAYEFVHPDADSDGDGMPDWWELDVGLNATNSNADEDPDGDMADNLSEYRADTNPTDADSVLRVVTIGEQAGGTRLDWTGGQQASQFIESSTALSTTNWVAIYGIPPPTPSTNALIHFGNTNQVLFYRIRAHR